MRKFLLATIIAMLVFPLFFFSFPETSATPDLLPFIPHEVRVLVVSPANTYWKGGHYLISDLARYGFNVTQHTSDSDVDVNYLNESKTSDLSQYNVVILHGGYFGFPPTTVTEEEVNHFTNYGGILIVIGNALFGNETKRARWDNFFASEPILKLEQRLGVDFTAWLNNVGATYYHNNGTFTLTSNSINGLPSFITYVTAVPGSINYQVELTPKEANKIYDFTTENGKTTSGVTYYKNASGAVGIYIQGSYIYSFLEDDPYRIRYFGLTNITKRSSLLASLIAFALDADINTIIKPQPLASVRLDYLGRWGWDETYLNYSLSNFNSIIDAYDITPTIKFTDFPDFYPQYWTEFVPNILSQLKSVYRDWEYSSSLRNKDSSSMTADQIKSLIQSIKGNYTHLGMDLFSTIATMVGYWNQTTLDAMFSQNLYLLDMAGEPVDLEKYYPDWWNLSIISKVIMHCSAKMAIGWNYESFTQIDPDPDVAKNILHYEYFKNRDKWALAVVNGFPCFIYTVWHFRRNEVGNYSLGTVCKNLTSEIPEIRFVPLIEAGLYFGNKWVSIENSKRTGSTIEFDIDSSAIPEVVSIGKGMLWLRIGTNETISEVSINNEPWFYFDDHTVRLPAESVHVKVTLGERVNPTVIRTVYKVTETRWEDERFTVSVSATPGLNVSIKLLIPFMDAFCNEDQWGYTFDAYTQILYFWAISDEDGLITLEVGADVTPPFIWSVDRSPTWYNTSVTIVANITESDTGMRSEILGYSNDSDWNNVTMVLEDNLYVGVIPAFRYGTFVQYKVYASDNAGNWRTSEVFSYKVTDETLPKIGVPEWDPVNPSAGQPVLVQISIDEPENASGLDTVRLYYFFNRDFSRHWTINMTYENDLWWAEIPGQSNGKVVSFFVQATDRARNIETTPAYSYKVGGGIPLLYILVAGLSLTAVAIGVGLYFKKFRKTKHKLETQK